jgi:hypothetical protein
VRLLLLFAFIFSNSQVPVIRLSSSDIPIKLTWSS